MLHFFRVRVDYVHDIFYYSYINLMIEYMITWGLTIGFVIYMSYGSGRYQIT